MAPLSETMRNRIAGTLLVAAVGAMAVWVALQEGTDEDVRPAGPPPLLAHEAGGLRWTYHLPSGTEGLFDLAADPRCLDNLASKRPEDARRMRQAVEAREGAPVESLREHYREQIERIRSLGYL